jgi:uncharacterized membrane protein YhaH (DUF805 family)
MEKSEAEYNLFNWWYKVLFKNYVNFSGRARRAEFWNFTLVNFIIYLLLIFIGILTESSDDSFFAEMVSIVFPLFFLAMLLPGLAVLVRRLHDINKSGGYMFFYFVPLVGFVFLLIWLFTDDPKRPDIPELEFTGKY